MQLKRQSVEAWQNEKHYSKGNNTSENPIPRLEIFKPVDHVYKGQVRSGHNICCLCSFLYNRIEAFRKFSSEVENASCGAQFRYFQNQVSKKLFYTFEDIDFQESHAKLHKKPSETLGAD